MSRREKIMDRKSNKILETKGLIKERKDRIEIKSTEILETKGLIKERKDRIICNIRKRSALLDLLLLIQSLSTRCR